MGIFSLAGGCIGADIALWPWNDVVSLTLPVTLGMIAGFITGVLVVWVVRELEGVVLR
jgi:hypothetical protein